MRRILRNSTIFLILIILSAVIAGCAKEAPVAETPEVTETPQITEKPVEIFLSATETPVPLTPSPSPSPTPEPTPTPDPYLEGVEVTTLREGFCYMPLNDAMKKRITGLSYPANPDECLVSYDKLRYLRITYVDFKGVVHDDGEMIVHAKLAEEVLHIFMELYDTQYPLTSIHLVDDYGEVADDNLSMAADNTSSFCYRKVTGSSKLSRHSYGAAIDINPMRNPYIKKDGTISPPNGKKYADRSQSFRGKIDEHDKCYKIFKKYGWSWGGTMSSEKDYQHFSKSINWKN